MKRFFAICAVTAALATHAPYAQAQRSQPTPLQTATAKERFQSNPSTSDVRRAACAGPLVVAEG